MRKLTVPLMILALVVAPPSAPAQSLAEDDPRVLDARARWEMLNEIRRDKFDRVLPGAMRDNGIDMWIHVIRLGDPDPLTLDLGARAGTFVFSDPGEGRIERAVFGAFGRGVRDAEVYDHFAPPSELAAYVVERDPQVIAINSSNWLAVADGLSHTGYQQLVEQLGPVYSERLVSADQLITDFRVRRVQGEIVMFARAGEMTRRLLERALSNEVITPGITTLEDVGWWVQERMLEMGVTPSFGISTPGILYSAAGARDDGGERVIRRGDLLSYDEGIQFTNYGTDFKRHAYVLREGETDAPPAIRHAWQQGYAARRIIRDNLRAGVTAGEALAMLADKLEQAGYVYTPFVDIGEEDDRIIAALGDDPRTGISIDCHVVGNTGNSEVAVGPSFAPFRPDRSHVMIQPDNIFSLEFIVHTATPDGSRVAINFEDNAIVTANGVEWLYPPNRRLQLIR